MAKPARKKAAAPRRSKPAAARPGRMFAVHLASLSVSPANARREARPDVDDLLASLPAEGLLVPLLVRASPKGGPGRFEVIDGRRRLIALKQLARTSATLPIDFDNIPVFAVDAGDDAEALEKSLAAGTIALPLHIADQFEAFAELRNRGGLTPAQIAERFGLKAIDVDRALALGALAPDVRASFRAGVFSYETACAFAVVEDHKRQEVALAAVKRAKYDVGAHGVRRLLLGDNHDLGMEKVVAFLDGEIGAENVRKAGLEIARDLFNDRIYVAGLDKAQTLVADAIERRCQLLKGQGWKWARSAMAGEQSGALRFEAQQKPLGRGKNKWPPEQRATLGCAVWFDPQRGELCQSEGLLDPVEQRRDARRATTGGKPQPVAGEALDPFDAMPKPVQKILHGQLFAACVEAIESDALLAQLAFTAAMLCGHFVATPLRIGPSGEFAERAADKGESVPEDFAAIAAYVAGKNGGDQEDLFASAVAAFVSDTAPREHLLELLAIASRETRRAALHEAFDPAAIFEKLPRKRVLEMLKSGVPAADLAAANIEALKGADFIARAAELMRESAWIPDELYSPSPAMAEPVALPEAAE
jgi:ParB/RepB/Spo0J family partition protein